MISIGRRLSVENYHRGSRFQSQNCRQDEKSIIKLKERLILLL